MPGDVFEKDPFRAELKDDAGNIGPEVAGIIGSATIFSCTEGLAGVTGEDDVEGAAEGPGVERPQVGPDRGRGEVARTLGGDEDGTRPVLPFDEGACVIAGFGEHEAQIKASVVCVD